MRQVPVPHHVQQRAAECDQPVKAGLVQALGVFVDTIVICSCTANDHASGTGRTHIWIIRNEAASDGDEISSWKFWRDLYRSHFIYVQLFHISGNPVLCKK